MALDNLKAQLTPQETLVVEEALTVDMEAICAEYELVAIDLESMATEIEDAKQVHGQISGMVADLESITDYNDSAIKMTHRGISNINRLLDLDTESVDLENLSATDREAQKQIDLEGLKDTAKKVYEAIVKFFKELGKKASNLFKAIIKALSKMKGATSSKKTKPGDKVRKVINDEVELPEEVVHRLTLGDELILSNIGGKGEGVVDSLPRVLNVREISDLDDIERIAKEAGYVDGKKVPIFGNMAIETTFNHSEIGGKKLLTNLNASVVEYNERFKPKSVKVKALTELQLLDGRADDKAASDKHIDAFVKLDEEITRSNINILGLSDKLMKFNMSGQDTALIKEYNAIFQAVSNSWETTLPLYTTVGRNSLKALNAYWKYLNIMDANLEPESN